MITCVCFRLAKFGSVIRWAPGNVWRVTAVDFSSWNKSRMDTLMGEVVVKQEEGQVFSQDPFRVLAWNCNQDLGRIGVWNLEKNEFMPEFNDPRVEMVEISIPG